MTNPRCEAQYLAFKEGFLSLLRDISFAHGFYKQCEQGARSASVVTLDEVIVCARDQAHDHLLKHSHSQDVCVQPLKLRKVTPRHTGKPARTLMKQARWTQRAHALAPPSLVSA